VGVSLVDGKEPPGKGEKETCSNLKLPDMIPILGNFEMEYHPRRIQGRYPPWISSRWLYFIPQD